MLPTPEAISTGIRNRWAVSYLRLTIPTDNVYLGRIGERTEFPRTAVQIEEVRKELMTGTKGYVWFSVQLTTYLLGQDAGNVRGLIEQLMSWSNTRPGYGWPMPAGEMISVKPRPGGSTKPTGERKGVGDDIVLVTSYWEALAEGHRELNSL